MHIQRTSILSKPTNDLHRFFESHKTLYKVVLFINHLFRAAAMGALLASMSFSWPAKLTICFSSSLFYRLTVETHCAYKFALPSFWGGLAYLHFINRFYTPAMIWASLVFCQISSEIAPSTSLSFCGRHCHV